MSAEPLTREERERYVRFSATFPTARVSAKVVDLDRYEASVQAEETARKAAEERAERLRVALGKILMTHGGSSHCAGISRRALAADDAARGHQ